MHGDNGQCGKEGFCRRGSTGCVSHGLKFHAMWPSIFQVLLCTVGTSFFRQVSNDIVG